MKRLLGAMAALLLMGQAAPAAPVDALGWMAGSWESDEGGTWTEEVWSAPRGGAMLGYSRTGQGGHVGEFEYMRIEADADGVPVYLAQPGGAPAVPFRLTARDVASATFDNPGHDFPQRIVYRRTGDVMVATISALDGSHAMSWSYGRR